MALSVPKAPGIPQMLKEGAKMYSGLEEAVFRNIYACKNLTAMLRTSYGPTGLNKMIINHIDKQFITSDAGTILRELDVEHPAAKLIIAACETQDAEIGDGTNFVIIFAGALLEKAEELLHLGIASTEIVEGFENALNKTLAILPELVCYEIRDYRNIDDVKTCLKSAVMSKQYGEEDILVDLIAKACVMIANDKGNFNVDNVRICKILGRRLRSSKVFSGMVFKRFVEGSVTDVEQAKVAAYSCPIDVIQTETKGTVLLKSAAELLNFSKSEEGLLENQIKSIADAGVKVVVSGAKVGDMALHYLNKYNIMAVRVNSKFEVRRLCRAVNATILPRLTVPTAEEMGYCDKVSVEEIGDTSIVVFKNLGNTSRISTIVLRGATNEYLDNVERAIDDGINNYRIFTQDGRFVPGAGAVEIELATQIANYANKLPGVEQYAVRRFASALEMLPKTLAENSGIDSTQMINKLYEAHTNGKGKTIGINIDVEEATVLDAQEKKIFDLYQNKRWALKYATNAAITILKVDQIIMAKATGGPNAARDAARGNVGAGAGAGSDNEN